jgi:predicted Zn-dependent protease with MMP-like domain
MKITVNAVTASAGGRSAAIITDAGGASLTDSAVRDRISEQMRTRFMIDETGFLDGGRLQIQDISSGGAVLLMYARFEAERTAMEGERLNIRAELPGYGMADITYVPEISYARIEGDIAEAAVITEGEVGQISAGSYMVESGGFVSLDEFREMVSETLDELPKEFFRDLSGGVVVEEREGRSQYKGMTTLGQYSVGRLGRQVTIYYGSFRKLYGYMDRDELLARIRKTVRHEFRHHMEFLAGVHGVDSLEAEDRRQIREFLDRTENTEKGDR